jgi:hypothetical protein
MMKNSALSFLLLFVLAAMGQAFAPVSQPARSSTSLYINNAYARGGKPSWAFEADAMFIDEPGKSSPKSKAAPKAKKPVKKTTGAPEKMTIQKFFTFGK